MEFKSIENLEEAAELIAELNSDHKQQIGYCGNQQQEILHSLKSSFSDLPLHVSLIGAYRDQTLIGLLGFDIDLEEQNAEIWGPFIRDNHWQEIASKLWTAFINRSSLKINKFHAFFHAQNQKCTDFYNSLGFQIQNKHMTLKATADQFIDVNDGGGIKEITPFLYTPFRKCHDQLFPSTYYSGAAILNQLYDHRKVLISSVADQLQGYIFYVVDAQFNEGSIEYIGVNPEHRQKGIASNLLKAAMNDMFTNYQLNEIRLSVSLSNQAAIHLYESVGFREKDILIYSSLKVE